MSASTVVFLLISLFSAVPQLHSAPETTKPPNINQCPTCLCRAWPTHKNRAYIVFYEGEQWCVHTDCRLCVYLWFLVQQQTLIQVGESSIHWFSNPFAGGVGLPGLSVCHALVPVRLYGFLKIYELFHCQLYTPAAAPHWHCLQKTQREHFHFKTFVVSY